MLAKEIEEIGLININRRIILIKDVWLLSLRYNFDYSKYSENLRIFIDEVIKIFRKGMYYSHDYDLTNTVQRIASKGRLTNKIIDESYLWNSKMGEDFVKAKVNNWLVPLINGYVYILDEVVNNKPFKLVLISRRENRRPGTFEQTYGIDENGHVANMVETEEILYYGKEVYSFNQIRGSVPVFWTRESTRVNVTRKPEYSITAFTKHFDRLVALYNRVIILNLLTNMELSEMKLSKAFQISEETYEKNKGSAVKYYHLDINPLPSLVLSFNT